MSTDAAEQRAPDPVPETDRRQPFGPGGTPVPSDARTPVPADARAADARAADARTAAALSAAARAAAALSAADPSPAAPDAAAGADPAPGGRRPRPRTAVLLASALLLGVLGGAGTGYAVQAGRPPTPLPPLAAPAPHYPARPATAAEAAAAAPAPLGLDGDLRKLLLKRPAGTRTWDFLPGEDGWMPADRMALLWRDSGEVFSSLLDDGFRRAATVSWLEGRAGVRIRLIQYQSGSSDHVTEAVQGAVHCSRFTDTPCTSRAIPGTATGVAYVTRRSQTYADSRERFYYGLAVARRGDVVMRIDVHAPRPVDLRHLLDLARRQWERL
ncbi:hypothetical protein LO771_07645 [Streptacidiphilus sp. ASG 303]|uniref:hypothetical protein n=1 Tax=Streptacidiphilus sp. ASG 303 TaxID=2896847 RepID=UPI001E56C004|nr:hypothetical protein [Streptacidiphilus sp. ASG 303]MCD0482289.1 hypothetical protein [Streptacidiphilus sp. ASG 303]